MKDGKENRKGGGRKGKVLNKKEGKEKRRGGRKVKFEISLCKLKAGNVGRWKGVQC